MITIKIAGHDYQLGTTPPPKAIRAARKAAGHTQTEAAATVYRNSYQDWWRWEAGVHRMDPAIFHLYLIMTGQ